MIERAPLDDELDRPGAGEAEHPDQDGFTIRLERVFQGPLDLLLQLVREKELEIHLVSLGEVCDAYCQHVRSLRNIDVDQAADYLVVAATLLAIKSRSLLPQDEIEDEEDLFEPGEELVHQLLAYKALREAAEELLGGYEARKRLLPAGGRWLGRLEDASEDEEEELDLGEVSLWDLLRTYRRLEQETGFNRPHRVRPAGRPLRAYVSEVWEKLLECQSLKLDSLLAKEGTTRTDAAYYLVALLELAKQRTIDIRQDGPFGSVEVQRSSGDAEVDLEQIDEEFTQHDEPEAGELDELLDTAEDTPEQPPPRAG